MQQAEALELVVWYLDKVRKEKKRELKNAERKEKDAEESGWTAQIARKPEGWTSWRKARNVVKEQGKKLEKSELDFGLLYLSTCCRLKWKEEEEDSEEEEEDDEAFLRRREGLVFYRSPRGVRLLQAYRNVDRGDPGPEDEDEEGRREIVLEWPGHEELLHETLGEVEADRGGTEEDPRGDPGRPGLEHGAEGEEGAGAEGGATSAGSRAATLVSSPDGEVREM
jgi:hypothetical protein